MSETTTLPTWDEMSDVDKGCALLHVWKRSWEGASYAEREYPARYLEDPVLVALSRENRRARCAGRWYLG